MSILLSNVEAPGCLRLMDRDFASAYVCTFEASSSEYVKKNAKKVFFLDKLRLAPRDALLQNYLISIRHRQIGRARAAAGCSILSTMLAHSWGGCRGGGRGRAAFVEWKGVQSISHKSVCTARSPNAATLSSYSFDRDSPQPVHAIVNGAV